MSSHAIYHVLSDFYQASQTPGQDTPHFSMLTIIVFRSRGAFEGCREDMDRRGSESYPMEAVRAKAIERMARIRPQCVSYRFVLFYFVKPKKYHIGYRIAQRQCRISGYPVCRRDIRSRCCPAPELPICYRKCRDNCAGFIPDRAESWQCTTWNTYWCGKDFTSMTRVTDW